VPASMESPFGSYPIPDTLDDVLGFELVESTAERCRGRFAVEDRVKQPMGLVHGGAYAALAESLVSMSTHNAVVEDGSFVVGQSNNTTFLRPAMGATVHAEGVPLHRGRTTWVWDVSFTDDEGRLCAVSRMTVAVRPRPRAQPGRPGSSSR
jgi:1,4-dihydroxy-2-naphthoyl-CoA hydrolase